MSCPRFRTLLRLPALVLVGLAVFACVAASGKDYSVQSWSTGHNLEARGLACCTISGDGTVWIGAVGDLIRFDGVKFERVPFDLAREFSGDRITSLWEDPRGRLWCGYETGDVVEYDPRSGHARLLPIKWERQTVRAIQGDPLGEIWLLLDDHRLVRARDGWSTPLLPGAENAGGTLGFVTTGPGRLLAEYSGMVFQWRKGAHGGEWDRILVNDGYVPFVIPSRRGGMWIVNGDTAFRRSKDGAVEEARQLPIKGVVQILEVKSGELLVGTLANGIYSVDASGGVTHYGLSDGLPAKWIMQMAEDSSGNLVAVSPDSVSVLRVSEAQKVGGLGTLGGARLTGVTGAAGGGLWVGSEGAGLFRYRDGRFQHFGQKSGLSSDYIWSMLDLGPEGVWVGSWGGGLDYGKDGRFGPVPNWSRSGRWVVTALFRGRDGSLWAGTNGGIGRMTGGAWTWHMAAGGVPLTVVRSLAQGPGERIWFGTNGQGAGYVEGSRVVLLDPKAETGSLFASALWDDGRGGLWIGTAGAGLFHWKAGVWTHLTTDEGLPSNDIFHIDADGRGRVWFTSSAGVYSIKRRDLDAVADGTRSRVYPVTINVDDGLPSNQCAGGTRDAAYMDADGRYYVPTSAGLAVIDTRRVRAVSTILRPAITQVAIDGRPCPVAAGRPVIARPQAQSIRIHYTAPTLVHPELVEFAYRLDGGVGGTWINLGHSRSLLLQRLHPGSHVLEITAQSPSSVEMGPPVRLEIVQQPFLVETLWFRILVAAAAAALLALLVWIAVRGRYLRAHRRLELEAALEKERRRIARDIHDDLGAHLAQVMLLSQADDPRGDAETRKRLFSRIHSKAKEITKAFDELVWAINPSHDTVEGFASYAMRIAQETVTSANVRCRLRFPESMPALPLGSGSRHHLIMCMKEAIANALKHADCEVIEVRLEVSGGWLRLSVSDDGRGFDPATLGGESADAEDRSGLSNLRARMRELDGSVTLLSSPGKGTQVTFECPLS